MFNTPKLSSKTKELILEEFKEVDPFIISPWEWAKKK